MHLQCMQVDILDKPVEYNEVIKLFDNKEKDKCFILEHNDIYTAGKSVKEQIEEINGIKTVHTERGGLWTWHGKGQVVVYFIYNLHKHQMTLTDFFEKIEKIFVELIKNEINNDNFVVYADKDKRGFWIKNKTTNEIAKIGFIGLRVSKGVLTHGISINYNNDLRWFEYINPCGLGDVKITSIQESCKDKTKLNIADFKLKVAKEIERNF